MTWKVSTAGNGSNRRHLAQVNFVQLAGVLIIGSAGVIVLGLKGYWEPGVPFALALASREVHVQWWREQIKERGSLEAVYREVRKRQREYRDRDVG
jgi:hypothetical protein